MNDLQGLYRSFSDALYRMNRTPDDEKRKVIQLYLQGLSYDQILNEYHLGGSKGNISNIINEWKRKVGEYDAEYILDFLRILKKNDTSPIDCIEGARFHNVLKKIGANEENLELYVHAIDTCVKSEPDIAPEKLGEALISMAKLVERDPSVPVDQLPRYVDELRIEHRQLNEAKDRVDQALAETRTRLSEIEEYVAVKKNLNDVGVDIRQVTKVVNAVNNCTELGYDSKKIGETASEVEYLQKKVRELRSQHDSLLVECDNLKKQKSALQGEVKTEEQTLLKYKQEQDRIISSTSALNESFKKSIEQSVESWNKTIVESGNKGIAYLDTLKQTALEQHREIMKYIAQLGRISEKNVKLATIVKVAQDGEPVDYRELVLAVIEVLNIFLAASKHESFIHHNTEVYKNRLLGYLRENTGELF